MTTEHKNGSLLQSLQKLYSRVSMLVLHKRMHSHTAPGTTPTAHDIATPLSDHIDKLAVSEEGKDKGITDDDAKRVVQSRNDSQTGNNSPSQGKDAILNTILNGLAAHFSNNRPDSSLEPHLSEKLMKSTREHLHTAIRLAREGEVQKAKLHADIANHALKELAHYTTEENYKNFVTEVETVLKNKKTE